ncbi:MAG: DUF421 domain-containing protein [Clostridia bacterium]|nr:DUF421 domain-containing protein [Clostridia bacterium]
MPTLFIRTILVFSLMFAVLRLMGKRQISEMQPFDFAVTLLIANLASIPMSEPAVPLFYGLVPIIGLFIVQRLVSYASLKSEKLRKLICGHPLLIIEKGVVNESVMRAARYSLTDLTEQLRLKDVFSLSQVEYAILETNGSLSVLVKSAEQPPTCAQLKVETQAGSPALLLAADGSVDEFALARAGMSRETLELLVKKAGIERMEDCLFAVWNGGALHIQKKRAKGAQGREEALFIDTGAGRSAEEDGRRAGKEGKKGKKGKAGKAGEIGKSG